MKKNGFTLVEILAVIVITAIITVIASTGISAVKKSINNNLLESNILLIEKSATNLGEDKKSYLETQTSSCTIDNKTYTPCITLKVQSLIDKYYIKTKEVDKEGHKVLINYTKDESDLSYYMNEESVYIYLDDNTVYAKYMGLL